MDASALGFPRGITPFVDLPASIPLEPLVPGLRPATLSTGANVVAALRMAERLGPGATIVTVMCDTGMKYLKGFGARLG